MQVSLNWLNELVDLSDVTEEQIAHELTMSGLEVEALEEVKPKFTNIKTVRIEKENCHGVERIACYTFLRLKRKGIYKWKFCR